MTPPAPDQRGCGARDDPQGGGPCGKRLKGTHPNTVTARHGHHVEIQEARAALEDGIARREAEEDQEA